MSLSTALNIAQRSLLNSARQTSVVSQNITNASNSDYSRRSAVVSSDAPGASVVTIQRATNAALFRQNLSALSAYHGQSTLSAGIDSLSLGVNGIDNATSASILLGKLQQAIQSYGATPSSQALAENAVEAARQLAGALNAGTSSIQSFRGETDKSIDAAVTDLNSLLKQFEHANNAIIKAGASDASDLLDHRDALLKKISEYVPVTAITRDKNDMVLTTAGGVTLFETVPRNVTFEATPIYGADTGGKAVYVDGVAIAGGSGADSSASGSLAAQIQLRDGVAGSMQAQLDEIARSLIGAFAETGTGGALAARTGLFTWSGGPDLPPDGTIVAGLAGEIAVNAAFDADAGGDPTLLRDGGANGAAYIVNTAGASFADLILSYSGKLESPVDFDPASGIAGRQNIASYASASIGWVESMRKMASESAESKGALVTRTVQALSNATGVNIDEEMALLLDLEHSYQASARLIKAVDDMMAALLQAVG